MTKRAAQSLIRSLRERKVLLWIKDGVINVSGEVTDEEIESVSANFHHLYAILMNEPDRMIVTDMPETMQ